MLETLDLSLKLRKSEYRERVPALRNRLRDLQQSLREAAVPVVVLFEGVNATGKGDSIGQLVYPLDPRGFRVVTTREPNEEERFRPFLWRFWGDLPARGHIAFFDRSWYRRLLEDRLSGDVKSRQVAETAAEIRDFENQLTADGTLLVKFWLHISRKEQEKRIKEMKADPYERWRAARKAARVPYRKYVEAAEEMLALTSGAEAPWTLVESTDPHFRRRKVFESLIEKLESRVPRTPSAPPAPLPRRPKSVTVKPPARKTLLESVDLSKKLDRATYEKELDRYQERLRELGYLAYRERLPAVIVYEGWDAAGKGGNIKRLTQEMDPRGYEVIGIAAPDATERAHHYLWRFWNRVPKAGHMAIFDRSWYGRLLVERVEGFAGEEEWKRAFEEINMFERQLTDFGTVVVKFWLHLSPEEQLRRFDERMKTPHKRHKITEDDWRNRSKWPAYRDAVAEMIERTSTPNAPWTIVEAEDKLYARVKAQRTVVEAVEGKIGKKER